MSFSALPEWAYEVNLYPASARTLDNSFGPYIKYDEPVGVVTSASLTMDSGWSPRYQASVVVAGYHPALVAFPGMAYVRLVARRLPGVPISLADWSRTLGTSLKDWTAAGARSPLGTSTALGATPHKPALPARDQAVQVLELTLAVRGMDIDTETRTATLELSSLEMDLQEVKNLTRTEFYKTGDATISAIVLDVLKKCGYSNPRIVETDLQDEWYIRPQAGVGWKIGQTAGDFLNGVLGIYSAQLWAEGPGLWHITSDERQRARTDRDGTGLIRPTKITPKISPLRGTSYAVISHYTGTATNTGTFHRYETTGPNSVGRGEYREMGDGGWALPAGTTWVPVEVSYENEFSHSEPMREGSPFASAQVTAPAEFTIRPDWRYDLTVQLAPPSEEDPNPIDFTIGDWDPNGIDTNHNPSHISQITHDLMAGTMSLEVKALGFAVAPISSPPIVVP